MQHLLIDQGKIQGLCISRQLRKIREAFINYEANGILPAPVNQFFKSFAVNVIAAWIIGVNENQCSDRMVRASKVFN